MPDIMSYVHIELNKILPTCFSYSEMSAQRLILRLSLYICVHMPSVVLKPNTILSMFQCRASSPSGFRGKPLSFIMSEPCACVVSLHTSLLAINSWRSCCRNNAELFDKRGIEISLARRRLRNFKLPFKKACMAHEWSLWLCGYYLLECILPFLNLKKLLFLHINVI